jgi:hypothetical protein
MTQLANKTNVELDQQIFMFREKHVMIDHDLAQLYEVQVKRLNEQVKRNISRFPVHFRFQLSLAEKAELVANCDRFNHLKYSSSSPFAFTKLNSDSVRDLLREVAMVASHKNK